LNSAKLSGWVEVRIGIGEPERRNFLKFFNVLVEGNYAGRIRSSNTVILYARSRKIVYSLMTAMKGRLI